MKCVVRSHRRKGRYVKAHKRVLKRSTTWSFIPASEKKRKELDKKFEIMEKRFDMLSTGVPWGSTIEAIEEKEKKEQEERTHKIRQAQGQWLAQLNKTKRELKEKTEDITKKAEDMKRLEILKIKPELNPIEQRDLRKLESNITERESGIEHLLSEKPHFAPSRNK